MLTASYLQCLHWWYLLFYFCIHAFCIWKALEGMLTILDKWIEPYILSLIWAGLPFLDFRRELFIIWVARFSLTCLSLGYQFLSQEEFELQVLEVFFAGRCKACRYWSHELVIAKSVKWSTVQTLLGAAGHPIEQGSPTFLKLRASLRVQNSMKGYLFFTNFLKNKFAQITFLK